MRLFVGARTVSILGDRVAELVIPLGVVVATGSASLAGVVAAAGVLPGLLLGLHVGVLVDRADKRVAMVVCDLLRLPVMLALGAELAWGGARPAVLIPLALTVGAADSVFSSAAGAYVPVIVEPARFVRVNAVLEAGDASATLLGPALGGLLLQQLGIFLTLAADAASFAASVLLLHRLPRSRVSPAASVERPALLGGARLIIQDGAQLTLQVAMLYMYFVAGSASLVVILYGAQELQFSPSRLGLMLSGAGVGGLVSSLVLARFIENRRWGTLLAGTLLATAVAFAAVAASSSFAAAFASVALLDGASALAFITTTSARQVITDPSVLGQVLATSAISTGTARALGAGLAGAGVAAAGPTAALLVLAALALPPALIAASSRQARVCLKQGVAPAEVVDGLHESPR